MSLQPNRPLLDALRAALHRAEVDPTPQTPTLLHLKRLLRERIAELESTARLVDAR